MCVCWVSRWINASQHNLHEHRNTTTDTHTHTLSADSHCVLCVQVLDSDRLVLQKMKKAAKAKYTSGQGTHSKKHTYRNTHTSQPVLTAPPSLPPSDHVSHLEQYINSMEKLSVNCHSNGESEVGSAFCRLADFSKELLSPMKNLVSHQSALWCHRGQRSRHLHLIMTVRVSVCDLTGDNF